MIYCRLKRQSNVSLSSIMLVNGVNDMRNELAGTKSLSVVAMDQLGELDAWWLWPQRIPMGNLTLLVGDQDAGKSRVAWDLAARASRGDAWPDGEANPMGAGSV